MRGAVRRSQELKEKFIKEPVAGTNQCQLRGQLREGREGGRERQLVNLVDTSHISSSPGPRAIGITANI